MKKQVQLLPLLLLSTLSFAQLPQNKYKDNRDELHKERSRGFMLSLGYPVISQFLNPVFVGAKQSGQMQKAGANLSVYAEVGIGYPFSLQIGGYSGTFRPEDGLVLSNGFKGKDVEISHELLEGFICAKLLPNKYRLLPYIGVGYIDGGLKLGKRDDTAKDRVILSAIKIQSPAWRVGMAIDIVSNGGNGSVGLFADYMQPFQISGLTPNTFYAANRLQVGIFIKSN